jgi:hypothetical protein
MHREKEGECVTFVEVEHLRVMASHLSHLCDMARKSRSVDVVERLRAFPVRRRFMTCHTKFTIIIALMKDFRIHLVYALLVLDELISQGVLADACCS